MARNKSELVVYHQNGPGTQIVSRKARGKVGAPWISDAVAALFGGWFNLGAEPSKLKGQLDGTAQPGHGKASGPVALYAR